MIAVDTSVVVALLASWHEGHGKVTAALRAAEEVRLPEHVALETYSVLTRLPPPHRLTAASTRTLLERRFPGPWLRLGAKDCRRLLLETSRLDLAGGAVYDALVGLTARRAGAELVSRDRRAAPVYRALGVDYRMLL